MTGEVHIDHDNKPQVFAVSKAVGGRWTFSRRSFMKTAGITAAAGALTSCSPGNGDVMEPKSTPLLAPDGARAHSGAIHSVAISPDGTILASAGGGDDSIKLWLLPHGELLLTLESRAAWVGFAANDMLVSRDSNSQVINLWSLPAGELLNTLEAVADLATADSVAVSSTILAASDEASNVKVWSLPDGELLSTFAAGDHMQVEALAISPDGTLLASGSFGPIKLWSLPEGELVGTLGDSTSWVVTLAMSRDGKLLASGDGDGNVMVWSLPDGELLSTFAAGGHMQVEALAISPKGDLLATAGHLNLSFALWSLPKGKHLHYYTHPQNNFEALTISPDGKTLVTGSDRGIVTLWSLPKGEHLMSLIDIAACTKDFMGMQYSPDNAGGSVVTLPCESAIPEGAACICNCVQGNSCSCVGYAGTPGLQHYWYPN